MTSHWQHRGGKLGPVMKPTGMLTNSPFLRLELSRRCPRDHEHVRLVGGKAAAAQEYPYGPCEAICRGVASQKKSDMFRILYTLPVGDKSIASLTSLCKRKPRTSCWIKRTGGLGQLRSPSDVIHSIGPTVSTCSTVTHWDLH